LLISARFRRVPDPKRAGRDPESTENHDMTLPATCNRFLRADRRPPTKIRCPDALAALDPAPAKVIKMGPKRGG